MHGVVATDRSAAVVALAYVDRSDVSPRGRFTLRGLDPERRYVVDPVTIGGPVRDAATLPWAGGTFSGRSLAVTGLQAPVSMPEQVQLLTVRAVD